MTNTFIYLEEELLWNYSDIHFHLRVIIFKIIFRNVYYLARMHLIYYKADIYNVFQIKAVFLFSINQIILKSDFHINIKQLNSFQNW